MPVYRASVGMRVQSLSSEILCLESNGYFPFNFLASSYMYGSRIKKNEENQAAIQKVSINMSALINGPTAKLAVYVWNQTISALLNKNSARQDWQRVVASCTVPG